jgi:hypothetical protein
MQEYHRFAKIVPRRRDFTRWIAMAIGAAVAAVALVLTVLAAMGVIALIVA